MPDAASASAAAAEKAANAAADPEAKAPVPRDGEPAAPVAPVADPVADVVDARALGGDASPDSDTDALVRSAKSMRDVNETRQAKAKICLIVDDSRVIRKVSSKIATSLGYTVIEAQDGEEALARCKKSMPDLVLTDWQMPEMDGIEFVTALRAIPTSHAPTVVFCTSKGTAKDVHQGIRAGADDYIVKPFEESTLKAKLERLGVQ